MKKLVWLLAGIMAFFVIACGAPSTDHSAPPEIVSPGQSAVQQSKAKTLIASDFKPSVKVKSKDCYDYGVGCNVTYEVKVDVDPAKLKRDNHTYEVTYEVKGPKPNAQIGTVQIDPDGNYNQYDQIAQTASTGTKLTVSIREIERLPY